MVTTVLARQSFSSYDKTLLSREANSNSNSNEVNLYWTVVSRSDAEQLEARRQWGVLERFFAVVIDPRYRFSRVERILNNFVRVYMSANTVWPYTLDRLSARSRVILQYNLSITKLSALSNHRGFKASSTGYLFDAYPLTFRFGMFGKYETPFAKKRIYHTVMSKPHLKQMEDVYYTNLYDYSYIYARLSRICSQNVCSMTVARLFRQSRVSGEPLTVTILLENGYKQHHSTSSGCTSDLSNGVRKETENSIISDCIFLNRLQFLLDIELVRSLPIRNEEGGYMSSRSSLVLPTAFALCRALRLCEANLMQLPELFKYVSNKSNLFGGSVQTRVNLIAQINHKYNRYVANLYGAGKETVIHLRATSAAIVATEYELYEELLSCFGGDGSDGEQWLQSYDVGWLNVSPPLVIHQSAMLPS